MTAFYTKREFDHMTERAQARGDSPVDLVLCSDGVMRTEVEAEVFEKQAAAIKSMKRLGF